MRKIAMVLSAALALGAGSLAWAQGAPSVGLNGGNAPGAGSWGNTTARGNSNNRDIGTFENDPTGMAGINYRISGNVYGATRGPGAEPVEPKSDYLISTGPTRSMGGSHVPTQQQLQKGAQAAMVDPGPIPRPQLGGQGAGM